MKFEPLVTIVIPVYNGSNFLKEAIDSALNQTYSNIEILVVNDGSNDNGATEKIAKSYGGKIKYYLKKNGGVSTALNYAIKNMNGEYFSWLSHDDKYKPDKIYNQIEYINDLIDGGQDISKTIVYCDTERIDINGNFISKKKHSVQKDKSIIDCMLDNIRDYSICGCAVLIPKSAFDQVGDFREEIPTVSDADMWYRMMFAGYHFMHLNDTLVQSRQHQGQVSKRKQEQCEKEQQELHILIAKTLLPVLRSSDKVLDLACNLALRGFGDALEFVIEDYVEKKAEN